MGSCFYQRLEEHYYNVHKAIQGRDIIYWCCTRCYTKFDQCEVFERHSSEIMPEIIEAHSMHNLQVRQIAQLWDVISIVEQKGRWVGTHSTLSTAVAPSLIERRVSGSARAVDNTCSITHVKKYTVCYTWVVYKIPCTCGSAFTAQTAKCATI